MGNRSKTDAADHMTSNLVYTTLFGTATWERRSTNNEFVGNGPKMMSKLPYANTVDAGNLLYLEGHRI